ncbi:MAG: hypothetical protein RLZZ517_492 [Candidatus Parcubacteria bacterium]|jgi:hypothetical protein
MKLLIKQISTIALIISFVFPLTIFAEETKKTDPTVDKNTSAVTGSLNKDFNGSYTGNASVDTTGVPRALIFDPATGQYQPASVPGTSQAYGYTGQGTYGLSGSTASSAFSTCMAASGLTGVVKNAISSLTAGLVDFTRVPTGNAVQEGKDTGSVITGGVSWDQMGWCLVNGLIETIGDATVAWINTGFQGNPVFVDDPGQFFADVADIQAGTFLNDVTNGLLCTPIQDLVRINIANNYNGSINYAPICSFSAISGNLEQFMSGETFNWTDWLSYTQNPYNNPYGATIYGQIQLDQRISAALDLQKTQLQWNVGFLSKVDKETGKVTSPGSVIQEQVNNRLFSGQRRLEIADEFDEVVNALVNQLVMVAITEMTQSAQ